ncbi:MAG TPA: hypothetical protein VM553_09270 [Dongiaceae bacterium]|nr:hypothetical protein [Dongiaceae bacterium]
MNNETIKETAERIVKLDMEVEAPGQIAVDESALIKAREVFGQWIADVKGVVVNPAMGRVTVIDKNGKASSIQSADLCFMLSAAGITQAF